MKTIAVIITMIPLLCYSQRGHNKGNHGGNNGKHFKNNSHPVAYYKESNHHHKRKGPPYWAPAHGYKHRYVFFQSIDVIMTTFLVNISIEEVRFG